MQEELEIPHKVKLQAMEEEVDRHKDLYYSKNRELERSKSEFEAYSQIQLREASSQKEELELAVQALRRQLAELQGRQFVPEKDEQLRLSKMKVRELEYLIESAQEEVLAARKHSEEVSFEKEQYVSRHEDEMLKLRAQMVSSNVEVAALETSVRIHSAELEKKDAALKLSQLAVSELEEKLQGARAQLAEKADEVTVAKENFVSEMERQKSRFESTTMEQDTHCAELSDKLRDREEMLRRAQREMHNIQTRYEASEKEHRRNFISQLRDLQSKNQALELELAESRLHQKAEEAKYFQTASLQSKNLEFNKSEKCRLQREKDVLHEKVRGLEVRLDEVSSKLKRSDRDWLQKLQVSEDVSRSHQERLLDIQLSLEKANSKISAFSTDLSEAARTSEAYKERLLQVELKMKKAVDKEKKKAEAYKEKALQAHEKNKALVARSFGSSGEKLGLEGTGTIEIF